jgi:hypothetical protein
VRPSDLRALRAEADAAWAMASCAEAERLLAVRDPAVRARAYSQLTAQLAASGDTLLPSDEERVIRSFGRANTGRLSPDAVPTWVDEGSSPVRPAAPAPTSVARPRHRPVPWLNRAGAPAAASRRCVPGLPRSAGQPALRARPGLSGLALFWGVVGSALGGSALVLQSLGPPEGSHAVAHIDGAGPTGPRTQPPASASALPDAAPPPSAGAIALWPAEGMMLTARFGTDRADAAATREAGGNTAEAAPRLGGGRPAPAGPTVPDRLQRPWASGAVPHTEPLATALAGTLAGLERAGSATQAAEVLQDPTAGIGSMTQPSGNAGPESLSHALDASVPGGPTQAADGGVSHENLPVPPPPTEAEARAPGSTLTARWGVPPADPALGGADVLPAAVAEGPLAFEFVPGAGMEGEAVSHAAGSDAPLAPSADAAAPAERTAGTASGPVPREVPTAADAGDLAHADPRNARCD